MAWPLALAAAGATAVAHCGLQEVDAVIAIEAGELVEAATPGLVVDGGSMVDTGNSSPTFDSGSPFPLSNFANSDPWALVKNHDVITVIRPNVLVLNFCNNVESREAEQKAKAWMDTIRQSSAYHGYRGGGAEFLDYQLVEPIMDLTDPPADAGADSGTKPGGSPGGGPGHGGFPRGGSPGCESSTKLPINQGTFDVNALFTRSDLYSQLDPNSPPPTLCGLFERGVINELWIMAAPTASRPPLLWESKRMYNETFKQTGGFTTQTGETASPTNLGCGVTVRIAYLDPTSEGACTLVGLSVGLENMHFAIPYLKTNASHFFNQDLGIHYKGMVIPGWEELVDLGNTQGPSLGPNRSWCTQQSTACITYPSNNSARVTFPPPDTSTWTLDPLDQGCGTAHFPPNARFKWDWGTNNAYVLNSCEHYLMQDGVGGSDFTTLYNSSNQFVAQYTQQPQVGSKCGGGWQVYLRQSMPGYGAFAADGSPIKNWWPFLFY
jgi:hypothetical protein